MSASVQPGDSLKYHVEFDEVAPGSVLGHILCLISPGTRVLELGCATGSMTRVLRGKHGCRVDAVEIDAIAAEQARPYCERLLVADVETLPWDDPFFSGQRYDHVLLADVLKHLRNPARVLHGVRSLLEKDGTVVISTPHIGYAGVRAALQQGWFPYRPTGLLDEGHAHFFTRFELEALLLESGLVPVQRRAVHWGPQDSEFAPYWQRLDDDDRQRLLDVADATVYQWVMAAALPAATAWRSYVALSSDTQPQRWRTQPSEREVELQNALADTQRRLDGLLDRLRLDALRLHKLERDLQTAQAQRDQAQTQRDQVQAQLASVLASRSWRLTAPLRNGRALLAVPYRLGRQIWRSVQTRGVRATLQRSIDRLRTRRALPAPATAAGRVSELLSSNWGAYRAWLAQYEDLPADGAQRVLQIVQDNDAWPRLGIIMPVYNPQLEWIAQAIESVRRQWYPHWHLYVVDDASTLGREELGALLQQVSAQDPRIRVIWRERNGHISAATNDGLYASDDDWVTFLDQDDVLAPHALWCVARAIRQHPGVRVVYSDEDKVDECGLRFEPHFKPDWNPDLLLSYNYLCHLVAYRREDIIAVGGLRVGYEGAQDYDLALRVTERCAPEHIVHIPRLLYHWRAHAASTAGAIGTKPYALEAGRRALQEALQRRGTAGSVTVQDHLVYRVRYRIEGPPPHVTIVVPTRNGGRLLQTCIEGTLARTDYAPYDIVIIDNGSDDANTLSLLQRYQQHPQCRVVRDPRPFNYAALHNAVVPQVQGDFVLLLNDDVEVIHSDWLTEMVSVAVQPGVGVVGARLRYPNGTLQHGGVILVGVVAGHAHKHLPAEHWGYMMRAQVRQTLSAVTGACLLLHKAVYQQVGGMDENLAVAYNDVALCLAVGAAGYRIVWTPYAELIHHESATRGAEDDPQKIERFLREARYMWAAWGDRLREDPALNPNLDNMREDFALARPPRLPPLL